VWVANSGAESVSQIDPATKQVIDTFTVRGGPDDVAVTDNTVWVTTGRGALWRLEPGDDEFREFPDRLGIGGISGHLDVAAEGSDLFVQVEDGPLLVVDDSGGSTPQRYEGLGEATDVAVHGDVVWVYERSEARVVRFDRASGERLGETPVGDAASQDLAATEGYGWFFRGPDATLIQIRAEDGVAVGEVPMKGNFGAISAGADGVWVMTASSDSGAGNLYRVGSDRAEKIDAPVLLGGLPYDVVATPEGIWITNHSAGTVTRLDLRPVGAPEPEPAPDVQVLFYYSTGADIFAYRTDRSSDPIADEPELEVNPALSPSGGTLVYEEQRSGERSRIMLLALDDDVYPAGTREELLEGEWPALSPTGELAWVEPGESATATKIGVGPIASEPRAEIEVNPPGRVGPIAATRLAWSSSGQELLYEAEFSSAEIEDHSLYSVDVPGSADAAPEPTPPPGAGAGEVLTSPAVHPEVGTTAIRLCCGAYPEWEFTSAELGVITDDGFETLVGLDELGITPGFSMFAVSAGTLDYDETAGWSNGSTPTWLVGDGEKLLLVSNTREPQSVPLDDATGLAVVPDALSDD
jgi:YVTN family beta-propeller protein